MFTLCGYYLFKVDLRCVIYPKRWFARGWWRYPLGADTQRLHQAGVSLSHEGGGGRGAGGAGGELPGGRGRGDGQGHGAGLLLHPLDAARDTSAEIQQCIYWVKPWTLLACICPTHCAMFQALQEAATEGGLLSINKEAEGCQICTKAVWVWRASWSALRKI